MNMEELILERGFIKDEIKKEYVRGNWTIRIDNYQVEIFNNPDSSKGFYYIDNISDICITDILDDIDEIDRSEKNEYK